LIKKKIAAESLTGGKNPGSGNVTGKAGKGPVYLQVMHDQATVTNDVK